MTMPHVVHQVPSMEHIKGPIVRSHEGSQSHTGTEGCPPYNVGAAGTVGEGTPTRLESGAPHGMNM